MQRTSHLALGLGAVLIVAGGGALQSCGGSGGGGSGVGGGGTPPPPPAQTALPMALAPGQLGLSGNLDGATGTTRVAPKQFVVWGGEVADGYTWTFTPGEVQPLSVSLNPQTGVIGGGGSLQPGTHTVFVTVSDLKGTQRSFQAPINVSMCNSQTGPVCGLPVFQGVSAAVVALLDADESFEYAASLLAEGGTPPYSWSVASGNLPPGMVLSASRGVVRGKPLAGSANQTYTFTVQIQDSAGNTAIGTNRYSIRVVP